MKITNSRSCVRGRISSMALLGCIAVSSVASAAELENNVSLTGLASSTQDLDYTFDVPSGANNLNFVMSGGSGDADLYVRYGAAPTSSTYDCRP